LDKTEKFSWEVLPHPPYQLDLAPLDYHLFRLIKDHMRGQYYQNNEAIQQTKRTWLQNTETDFFHHGILKLMQCWQKWPSTMKTSGSPSNYAYTAAKY
jgi:histone-lysine N-methyltransferase SETMAR